jgi:uncharacterized protein DUF402
VPTFAVGDRIEMRTVRYGKVWLSIPVRVLADDGDALVVYLAEGAPFSSPDPDFPWGPHPWLGQGAFRGHGVVMQLWPDVAHSVWAFWQGPERAFAHWYVNFQEPFRRVPAGFETFDQELDLIVRPDGSYRWKDVEEFEQLARAGRLPPGEAAAVRAEARRVAAALDRGERWWDESWAGWQPR